MRRREGVGGSVHDEREPDDGERIDAETALHEEHDTEEDPADTDQQPMGARRARVAVDATEREGDARPLFRLKVPGSAISSVRMHPASEALDRIQSA